LLEGVAALSLAGCAGPSVTAAPAARPGPRDAQGWPGCEQENEVLPIEDLMREHGVLRRIAIVYREHVRRIDAHEEVPVDTVTRAASIVRRFVEDYHERLEEDEHFPRFERARKHVDLVRVLRDQHQAGRRITDEVARTTATSLRDDAARRALANGLTAFVRMYDAHAAREDTVLFPALHGIVTAREYDEMGERFEAEETRRFGEGGFDKIVAEVAEIEKALGVDDLARYTP
jgi:hemerythrin-like domain-containing protein